MAVVNGCPYPKDFLTYQSYTMNIGRRSQQAFSIEAFQAGKHWAYDVVFHNYYQALCLFANKLIQDPTAAEDIAQESLIKLWEKHAGFDSPFAIKSFLYITAKNACFNFLKRTQNGEKLQKIMGVLTKDSEDYVWNELTRVEVVRAIQTMLKALPNECRKIMEFSIVDGLDNHEIAQRLSISVHTVKNQKARAVYLMKKKFGNKPLLLLAFMMMDMHTSQFESIHQMQEQHAKVWTMPASSRTSGVPNWQQLSSTVTKPSQFLTKCATYTISLFIFFCIL